MCWKGKAEVDPLLIDRRLLQVGIHHQEWLDFVHFERLGLAMQPDDKDAALLPRRVDGNFALVHRPMAPRSGCGRCSQRLPALASATVSAVRLTMRRALSPSTPQFAFGPRRVSMSGTATSSPRSWRRWP